MRGGTISPGGAGALLGITRQRVYTIAQDHADVRAWAFYEEKGQKAEVFEIAVEDLLRWAVRRGRIKSEADLGLPWSRAKETLARVLQNEVSGASIASTG